MRVLANVSLPLLLSLVAVGTIPAQGQLEAPALQAPQSVTNVNIGELEAQSQADPENLELRRKLLVYYGTNRQPDKYVSQAIWLVQHHPESPVAVSMTAGLTPDGTTVVTRADYALVKGAWEQALTDGADSARVLSNAALFLQASDPLRAFHLLEQAEQIEPNEGRHSGALVTIGGLAIRKTLNPAFVLPGSAVQMSAEDARAISSEISSSSDPGLLSRIGLQLARAPESNREKEAGLQLISRAVNLEPENPRWKADLEQARNPVPPPPPPPPAATRSGNGISGPVRIGAQVAEANLIRKVSPVYPPLALAARISGTVEFTAIITTEGYIGNLQLVRGHPLLVNAAKEAVSQYAYRPTLLNGNPVSVTTSIVVPFTLPSE